jgi:uncharacterized protein YdgA (DUF945 family)
VKKGIVILLLALAVIVLISPGIVGRLAERSMDENLDWAATETNEVTITSQGFDRGWFSSEGQHRVELRDGELRDALMYMVDDNGRIDLPALIIDTRIDHGLVPVTSMAREKGSLAPGLGRAVSTLHLEFEDGNTVDLPGTIYSEVGLGGELKSNLVLDAGSYADGAETAHWGPVDVLITTSPSTHIIGFSGSIDELLLESPSNDISVGPVSFDGERQQTRFGIAVGDAAISIASITMGELGRANVHLDIALDDVDGEALGNITRAMDEVDNYTSGNQMMLALEDDLQKLLATGFQLRVDQLDVVMQPGTVSARLNVDVAPTDLDNFVWTSALMALDATLDVSIPAELYDYAVTLDPQVSMAVGMGYLRRNGDVYEMEAAFQKGLLTVNGAPMPIPLPGGN